MCYQGALMKTRLAAAAVAAIALVSGACSRADYIEIEPDIATLKQKNNMVWLRARAKAHSGQEYPLEGVNWKVKDESIAAVDATGKVTPIKSGRTEVVASSGDITASIPVEVLFAEKLKVEPNPLVLDEDGESVDLKVTVYDWKGRELRDRGATFKSMDPKVLTMGQNAAHPGQAGTTKVEVRVDELVQVVDVTVAKAGKRK